MSTHGIKTSQSTIELQKFISFQDVHLPLNRASNNLVTSHSVVWGLNSTYKTVNTTQHQSAVFIYSHHHRQTYSI